MGRWHPGEERLINSAVAHFATAACVALACVSWGCSHRDGDARNRISPTNVAKAKCGPEDRIESGLQGQVPAASRRPGFEGFNCNLSLIGQYRGEGAGWQAQFVRDSAGHSCAYYDTSPRVAGRKHMGVVVVDLTSPMNPVATGYLTSAAMLDPQESLKVNVRRQLLAAVRRASKDKPVEADIYDVSADCRFPRLLSHPARDMAQANASERINDGAFSPDGKTYYATSLRDGTVHLIDLADPASPRLIAEWSMPFNQQTSGLAISDGGNRAYFTLYGQGATAPHATGAKALTNGLMIADVSEVQARRDHPQPKVIASLVWGDGSSSHQLLPIRIHGRPYLVATDEGGSGYPNSSGWKASCKAGLPAWPMARLVDIGDERAPRIVASMQLEMNDPLRCEQVLPDLTGLSGFTYGSHYCSVDDPEDATAMACAYFESGIRVFDIRNPAKPREIAYFVPPAVLSPSPGSFNNATAADGRPDHCAAQLEFDRNHRTLTTTCQDNGLLVLRFANGSWPFEERDDVTTASRTAGVSMKTAMVADASESTTQERHADDAVVAPPAGTAAISIRGTNVSAPSVIRIRKGERVTISISSDRAGKLEVHGYRQDARLAPGAPTTLTFVAVKTGRFPIDLHASDGKHLELTALEVMPE